MSEHALEVNKGERFEFGKNWNRFLSLLDEERIHEAELSLRHMLEVDDLQGKSFLDIGSGSGLFSLAARRLGARVHSFDYDPNSTACTAELKRRYFENDANWTVEEGSALDADYVCSLGKFDVVYSWGVLHHTGKMWAALENAALPVAQGGKLFIAIYNDQGGASQRWTTFKKVYNQSPVPIRFLMTLGLGACWELRTAAIRMARLQNPFSRMERKTRGRGMSLWFDLVDWAGGYPFEVAKPEQLLDFFRQRGYELCKMTTCGGGHGCNQLVFERCHTGDSHA